MVLATNCRARTVRPSSSAMPVALPPSITMRSMRDLRRERPAGRDEGLHQAARQIERAALAELVAALQVEGADHRAHRARLRQGVDQPGAEQRHLEQEQELARARSRTARRTTSSGWRASPRGNRGRVAVRASSASRSACGSGSAKRSGRRMLRRDLLGLAVPVAEGRGVLLARSARCWRSSPRGRGRAPAPCRRDGPGRTRSAA